MSQEEQKQQPHNEKEQDGPKTLACGRCQREFEAIVPKADVISTPKMNMIIWVHEDPTRCPFCNQAYQITIQKLVGFEMAWVPVQTDDGPRIITAPGSALPKPH